MTAQQRVLHTQRILGAAAIVFAMAWGLAAGLAVIAALSFASLAVPQLETGMGSHEAVAFAFGAAVASVLLWRVRYLTSSKRVALWLEERSPDLHYSLITAVEHADSPFARDMERTVAGLDVGNATWVSLRGSIVPAIGALTVAAVLLYVSPSASFGRAGIFPRLGRSAAAVPAGSRLENLKAEITPPAYAGGRTTVLDDPSSVRALTGSRVVLKGDGSEAGIEASVPGRRLSVIRADRGWSVSLVMPARPAALTFRDRTFDRIVVLDPQTDAPPRIALTSPSKDTTLRAAKLVLRLNASASDDIGLGAGYFEYLITTGSGEIFSARTVTTPPVQFNGAKNGSIAATLDLASLKLNQGDVVSIRAIVQDRNTLSGPGLATSDTRTFRIARAEEYDSVSVDAAAPLPVDSSAMSQRMLIIMTEKLVREQRKLSRAELVKQSGIIGDLEDRIRKRVQEILYENEEAAGGEEAATADAAPDPTAPLEEEEPDRVRENKNPDLFEAFNELWAAVRSLQIAEPAPALPHMRAALKALDRVRLANRLYLRGTPPKVIVDIARVRMTGKTKGTSSSRIPGSAADSARLGLERRFNDAIDLIGKKPEEAVRAITLMQVDALSVSPAIASALAEAVDAFRRGRDATLPLLRARRAIFGGSSGTGGLPAWSGGL